MNADEDYQSNWAYLTEPVLLEIFQYLGLRDVLNAGAVCKNWNTVSYDNLLWRSYFRKDFNIDSSIKIKPGKTSWYKEYKRLIYHTPLVETEVLKIHAGLVQSVTFSHNGRYFVTCAMDGFILVWNTSCPASIKYAYDMKQFRWTSTQYAEFNEADTLLLVSGSHFGKINDSSSETAIFSFERSKMTLIGRILNNPNDMFGTFYSDEYIFSGQVQQIGQLVSSSSVWIHKAYPDVTSEHKPLMSRIFRFLNVNASFIRNLMVATYKYNNIESDNGNGSRVPSISNVRVQETDVSFDSKFIKEYNKLPWFLFHEDYESMNSISSTLSDSESLKSENLSEQSSDNEDDLDDDSDDDLLSQPEKYLIFTTGSKTIIPHQIGIKKIGQIKFPKTLDPGPSLAERIAECKQRAQRPLVTIDNVNIEDLSKKFDSIDHVIELHGHIIGMKLSPDHRYLYVNCRPWPEGYVITDPLDPPPIAQQIEIHVIDLTTFKELGVILRAHKAYTPSDECSLIFLDVCNDYIASGSEDGHGYLWDRYYGISLTKFPHSDVVKDVAFNPKDPETLVTVSDDNLIKIWRSRARTSQLFSTKTDYPRAVKLSPKRNIAESLLYVL